MNLINRALKWLIKQQKSWRSLLSSIRRWQSLGHWFLLSLGCCLCFSLVSPTMAQAQTWLFQPMPRLNSITDDLWWNPSGPRRCGRLLCANVLLYGDREGLIIAAPLNQDAEDKSFSLEERSRQLQASFSQLIKEIPSQALDLPAPKLWSPQPPSKLHPQLPDLEIGLENDQTVIYVPQQQNLAPRTLITVTNFDVKQNRQISAQALAEQWRQKMNQTISSVLWGQRYDAVYPLGRPLALIGIALTAGVVITLIDGLKRWVKRIERELRRCQKQLRESLQLLDPEVASVEDLDAATQAAELQSTAQADAGKTSFPDSPRPAIPLAAATPRNNDLWRGANVDVVAQTQILINQRLQFWLEYLPRPSLGIAKAYSNSSETCFSSACGCCFGCNFRCCGLQSRSFL